MASAFIFCRARVPIAVAALVGASVGCCLSGFVLSMSNVISRSVAAPEDLEYRALEEILPDLETTPSDTTTRSLDETRNEEKRMVRFADLVDVPSRYDPPVITASEEATIVKQADWFTPTKICKSTCCAETVAVSLSQDEYHIKNTIDGLDLADALVRGHNLPPYLKFTASTLSQDLLPCLQPKTIIHVDSYTGTLRRFYNDLRPNITVPHILITGDTDELCPSREFADKLETDELLIHWYGMNPERQTSEERNKKFTGIPLGLSKYTDQGRLLTHLQRKRNFVNPFLDKSRWVESTVLAQAKDTTDLLFVKFSAGDQPYHRHRKEPFKMACSNRSSVPKDNVTCTLERVPERDTLRAASNYLFGLSPPGNGQDCYRTYELLMLGVIPIVKAKPEYDSLFEGLPVIQLPGWNYTQQGLVTVMRDYVASSEFRSSLFPGWERLHLRYWRRHVLEVADRTKDIVTDANGEEYYQMWSYSYYVEPEVAN